MAVLETVLLGGIVLGCAYFRLPAKLWLPVAGFSLTLISIFGGLNFFILSVAWLLLIAAVLFITLNKIRRRYIVTPLINRLTKQMPTISQTEREAIEAGNVWWEKELFCGRPYWKSFLNYPKPVLSNDEEEFLNNQVENLCSQLSDWEIVNTRHDLPPEVWAYLKKERFFGLIIPKQYGGLGFSALAHSTVVMKIATRSVSAAVNMMVPNSLGPAELLIHYGTNEQKEYYLPRLARGEDIPCFALTGPQAGSDAGAITDTGVICRGMHQGKEIIGIRLSWDKRYITLAPIATVLGLAFRLYDPEHLLGEKKDYGITLCLVPTSHPGVEIGNRHIPLHLAFMNGPTRGKDVFIPLEWIIGGPAMAGYGWHMLMESLSVGRAISLPALSTACGKLAVRMTGAYARIRRQFNTAIGNFEGIEEALAQIGGLGYLLESARILTASAVDQQIKPAVASAIAKYNMTEMARKVVAHAMDIQAGHAIQAGPRNYLAHAHMAIPVSITVEGANILTRNLIIFGQGAIRCHPYVLAEVETLALQDSPLRTKQMDKLLLSHIGYFLSNLVRACWYGLTRARFIFLPIKVQSKKHYRQITHMSTVLALLSDVTMMLLGGSLKRKERLSARLGDMLSQLYLASAVLKYFNDHNQPASDVSYVDWCVKKCMYDAQTAAIELLNNFPNYSLGRLLKIMLFPFGKPFKLPSDVDDHAIVKELLAPSLLRERLTQYFYVSQDSKDPIRITENAFKLSVEVEPVLKKFHQALRSHGDIYGLEEKLQYVLKQQILTENEVQMLRQYSVLQNEVIQVNEFNFDLDKIVM